MSVVISFLRGDNARSIELHNGLILRNNSIDLVKLIASFCVVSLHVGFYEHYPPIFGEIIRLSGRWAVPFFFIVSGYFIGLSRTEGKELVQVVKVIKIFFISSLIFSPLLFVLKSNISIIGFFRTGTWFHLWFLSSLIIGLVFFWLVRKYAKNALVPLSILSIILYAIFDVQAYIPDSNSYFSSMHSFIRHSISFPFIVIGYHLSKNDRFKWNGWLFSLALIAYFIEPFLFNSLLGSIVEQRQFPLATVFVTICIFMFCLKSKPKESKFSEYGRKYSLGIYIIHPIVLAVFSLSFAKVGFEKNSLILLFLGFLFSLLLMMLIEKFTPKMYRVLNGDF